MAKPQLRRASSRPRPTPVPRYKLVPVIPPVHEGISLLAASRGTTIVRVVQEAVTAYLRLYEPDIRAERTRASSA